MGWLFERIVTISGNTKKKDDEKKQELRDASFFCEKTVLQADEKVLKDELGSSYEAVKQADCWLICYKKIQYKVIDHDDDSFSIAVDDDTKVDASTMEKVFGKIAYSFQKICNAPIKANDEIFKANQHEPTKKEHAILVAKLLIIIISISTIVFRGKSFEPLHLKDEGQYESTAASDGKTISAKFSEVTFVSYEYYDDVVYYAMLVVDHESENDLIATYALKSTGVDVQYFSDTNLDMDLFEKSDYILMDGMSMKIVAYIYTLGNGKIKFIGADLPDSDYYKSYKKLDQTVWKFVYK